MNREDGTDNRVDESRLLAGNLQQFDVAGDEIEQETRSGLVTRAAQRPGVDDARPAHQIIGAAQRVAVENDNRTRLTWPSD